MESPDAETLDRRFGALADDTRRLLWRRLGRSPGATTAELTAAVPFLSRWAVMKHLAVMRDSGLIQTLADGRRRRHYRIERSLDPLTDWIDAAS